MTLRIGLIGCGRWGRLILRDLTSAGAQVHVAAPTDATLAQALALGARTAERDILALGPMDGYVVATPTATHAAVLEQLLPTGRPIFVEKPMTADLASARRLAAAAGDRLFVMDKWRYHPGIEAMRAEISAGAIGEVLAIRTQRWGWGNPHDDVSALWILAPHDLSITQHLIGEIPPLRSTTVMHPAEPDLGFTVQLAGDRGPSVSMDIGIASPGHQRRCLVVGRNGAIELRDGYDDKVFARIGPPGRTGAAERVIEVGRKMPLQAEIETFLSFVAGGPPPMSTACEGLRVVERITEIEATLAIDARRAP
ncbi:Gfo/Idh/MocA family protein [Phreatobacter stygius]|uniref:Gfo/Idh/MocA family protein n=1 Tax=Phreatobacter stygius TaxID=1940610 RepID=UPI001476AAB9|nr:Gfo/Idh/MocA family oxidoreductase [Phreatobacter stygius]